VLNEEVHDADFEVLEQPRDLAGRENCFWKKDMLGGCWYCGVVEQEAGGQQAQVGSLRAGARGVSKMSSKGKVIGFRRMWKALWWLLG
jgi:hypothetical protein